MIGWEAKAISPLFYKGEREKIDGVFGARESWVSRDV